MTFDGGVSIGLLVSGVGVALTVLRKVSRIEMKIDLLWLDYCQRHGIGKQADRVIT